ncbi:divalent-cation tolerance protein CutA [Aliikangiella sp. G2MR2-5]|uniref:divalent-cation tolerance protein CutA n=1 Tax=Aliikangiella sp. G2MR2-5 TaxID=2788943 RepID=UPI0018A979A3
MTSTNNYRLCLTTVDSESTARQIAENLLKQKLVACVNISAKQLSLYYWQGKICEEAEYLLMMKTGSQTVTRLEDSLMKIHPYDVPEFIVLDIIDGSNEYFKWIDSSLEIAEEK